jgi:hypothetical protein
MHRARLAGAALTALITASSAWGSVNPDPGRYLAKIVVAEVHGRECPDHRGASYDGVVRYRGLDGREVNIRIPIVFDGYPVFDLQALTITSGIGTLRPRGKFSAHITAPINLRITGSFEAELTLSDDPEAFKVRLTEVAPLISCTEVFSIALVRSG